MCGVMYSTPVLAECLSHIRKIVETQVIPVPVEQMMRMACDSDGTTTSGPSVSTHTTFSVRYSLLHRAWKWISVTLTAQGQVGMWVGRHIYVFEHASAGICKVDYSLLPTHLSGRIFSEVLLHSGVSLTITHP